MENLKKLKRLMIKCDDSAHRDPENLPSLGEMKTVSQGNIPGSRVIEITTPKGSVTLKGAVFINNPYYCVRGNDRLLRPKSVWIGRLSGLQLDPKGRRVEFVTTLDEIQRAYEEVAPDDILRKFPSFTEAYNAGVIYSPQTVALSGEAEEWWLEGENEST